MYVTLSAKEIPTYLYAYIYMYIYTGACMHVRMYICMYVCMRLAQRIVLAYNTMEATVHCANPCKSIYPKMLALRTSSKSPTPTHNSHSKSIISTQHTAHSTNTNTSKQIPAQAITYTSVSAHIHKSGRANSTARLSCCAASGFTHSSTRRRMSDTTTTSMTRRDNYEYVRRQSLAFFCIRFVSNTDAGSVHAAAVAASTSNWLNVDVAQSTLALPFFINVCHYKCTCMRTNTLIPHMHMRVHIYVCVRLY